MNQHVSQPVRVGVVGLGKMGIMHAAMAGVVPGAVLAAVSDQQRGQAGYVASLGIRAPFFPTVQAMLDSAQLDLLVVSTPQFAHRAPSLAALERGVAVLCEKPLAHTMDDALTMAAKSIQHPGIPCATAFMVGHYPIYRHVRQLLEDRVLGHVTHVEARMWLSQVFSPKKGWIYTRARSGGGVLINSGAHPVYLLIDWFGVPSQVCAHCTRVYSHEVEDRVEAKWQYENGPTVTLLADWSVRGYPTQWHEFVMTGEKGRLRATDRTLHLEVGGMVRCWHEADFPQPRFNLTPHYGGLGFYLQMEDLVACVRRERAAPTVTWQHGAGVNRLITAVYRSNDLGGVAVALPAEVLP